MSSDSYLREINSIDAEIKRLNSVIKALRVQKRKAQDNLYFYMSRHKLESISDKNKSISIEKFAPPKPRVKSKPKKERKVEAIELFREAGIPNPEEFFEQLEATQKSVKNDNDEDGEVIKTKKKGGKNDYDDSLGF